MKIAVYSKTSRLLEDIGHNMQKNSEFTAAWVETEKSLDKKMICDVFGIDPERFVFIEYDADQGAEGILNMLYGFMTAVQFDMVVINSLKCLVPTKILEEEMEAQTPAVQARLWSKMVSKFLALVANNETAFVLITHLYTGIGTYGSPMVIAGGNAIRYWSSLSLSFTKKTIGSGEPIDKDDGIHVEVTIKKNHCVADRLPYKKFDYYALFGEGTEQILTTLKPLIDAGIVSVNGAFITIHDKQGLKIKTLQGKKEYRKYLTDNPDIFNSLIERLDNKISTVTEISGDELEEIEQEESIIDPLLQIPQKEQ